MLSWSNYVNHKNAVKISLMELNLKTRQLMVLLFFFFSHWELWQSISTFRAFPTVGKTNVSPKRLRLREILLESARCAGIRGWNRNSHLNSNSATDRAFFIFVEIYQGGFFFNFSKNISFLSCRFHSRRNQRQWENEEHQCCIQSEGEINWEIHQGIKLGNELVHKETHQSKSTGN